jgi:Fe-S cluster assembly iron-binding protein IscA
MTHTEQLERPIVAVTPRAATILKGACADMDGLSALVHLSVVPHDGGVAYRLELRPEPARNDVVFEQHEVTMAVSADQAAELAGTKLDYVDADGQRGRFVVARPEPAAS